MSFPKKYKTSFDSRNVSRSQRRPRERSPDLHIEFDSDEDEDNNPEKSISEVESPIQNNRTPGRGHRRVEKGNCNWRELNNPEKSISEVDSPTQPLTQQIRRIGRNTEDSQDIVEIDTAENPETSISEVESPIRRKVVVHSNKTVKKQTDRELQQLEIEVVICHIWKSFDSYQVLVKDSDNFISLLEISVYLNKELVECLTVGSFFRFNGLEILQKVTTKM